MSAVERAFQLVEVLARHQEHGLTFTGAHCRNAGKSFPRHCAGLGKVILAHMKAVQRAALLRESLPSCTDATITEWAALERELGGVLRDGFAMDNEEAFRDMICIASPVFDFMNKLIAAVSVSGPGFMLSGAGERERPTGLVRETGVRISEEFGYHPPLPQC